MFGDSSRTARRWGAAATSLAVLTAGLVLGGQPAHAASTSELIVSANDLAFILRQIQIAEAHASKEGVGLGQVQAATALVGPGPNDIANTALPWGLRQVDGRNNNLGNNATNRGAADFPFPRVTIGRWQAPYGNANGPSNSPPSGALQIVNDNSPRDVSNLIADMTPHDPGNANAMFNPAAEEIAGTSTPVAGSGGLGFGSVEIPNVAPAGGITPPYNSMFTFFGQFFDHGLDLIGKSASSYVAITATDAADPLATKGPMLMPRTVFPVGSNVLATAGANHTTPWIDQNQTYASVASKQVFLREYQVDGSGRPVATGHLLTNAIPGDIGTWQDVKRQAAGSLGLRLVDTDIVSVPLLLTDEYGRFLRGPHGFPQLVTDVKVNGTNAVIEGDAAAPVATSGVIPASQPGAGQSYRAVPTGHAFLDDIAHNAAPFSGSGSPLSPDADSSVGSTTAHLAAGTYDDELLDRHFLTGDGRGNENIGLTAIHTVFHEEHNRLADDIDATLHQAGNESLLVGYQAAGWGYGERLFQAARFVNENEYQHLVFETFVRRIDPAIHAFADYLPGVNPDVTAEFSQAVYRFGHSMLNETIPRVGLPTISLFDGFLNPGEFNAGGLDGRQAAAAIALGTSRQVGNEIDEFVTGALRNNLVGMPLDLAALNIARGRDVGIATLNNVRLQLWQQTGNPGLFPYDSWNDFAAPANLRHSQSLVNFLAAYGTYPTIAGAGSVKAKRAAAEGLLASAGNAAAADHDDAVAFLSGTDARSAGGHDWRRSYDSNGVPAPINGALNSPTGIDDIDLWMGGLAEARGAAAGLLGSTFSYLFRTQIEALQDGDRLYYVARLAGTHLAAEIENNTLADMFLRNSTAPSLPGDMFSAPAVIVDLNAPASFPAGVSTLGDGTVRYSGTGHAVFVGRDSPGVIDRMAGGTGSDTMRGFAGNDAIDGGSGSDILHGGAGDDRLTDTGVSGVDLALGGGGDDYFATGNGAGDSLSGGAGADTFQLGADRSVVDAGPGNDLVLGGAGGDSTNGQEGDDWIEGGPGPDAFNGDAALPTLGFDLIAPGRDVLIGNRGSDTFDGGGADDVFGLGDDDTTTYVPDTVTGGNGFDWVTYTTGTFDPASKPGEDVDLTLRARAVGNQREADMDTFPNGDVEGVSGGPGNDIIAGDSRISLTAANGGDGRLVDPIGTTGLSSLLTADADGTAGNILLGGPGADSLEGRGGNDLIDGDAALTVSLTHTCAPAGATDIKAIVGLIGNGTISGSCTASKVSIVRQIVTTPGDDTAVFTGKQTDYTITQPGGPGTAVRVVDRQNGRDGTDVLRNIEWLKFGSAAPVAVAAAVSGQLPPAPSALTVTPNVGTTAGGQVVSITGLNLTGAVQVSFGGTVVAPTAVTATSVKAVTPVHAAGTVDVSVTTASGTGTATGGFAFQAPTGTPVTPAITSITPPSGSINGAQTVVISGSGFSAVTSVTFAGIAAATYTVDSPQQITAVTPPRSSAGSVAVAVKAAGGTAALANGYTYGALPAAPQSSLVGTQGSATTTTTTTATTFTASPSPSPSVSETTSASSQFTPAPPAQDSFTTGPITTSGVTVAAPLAATVDEAAVASISVTPTDRKAGAPKVKVAAGDVVKLKAKGLPANAKATLFLLMNGKRIKVGAAHTDGKGMVVLPSFALTETGKQVVIVKVKGVERFVKVMVA